jgi:hypothetical protein
VFYGDWGFLGKMAKVGTFLKEYFVDIGNPRERGTPFLYLDLNIFYPVRLRVDVVGLFRTNPRIFVAKNKPVSTQPLPCRSNRGAASAYMW